MNPSELKLYEKWVNKSAAQVFAAAKAVGGWQTVFPDRLPRWASKVRNYFNILPTNLTRLPEKEAKPIRQRVQRFAFLLECHDVQTWNRTYGSERTSPYGAPHFSNRDVPAGCPAHIPDAVKNTSAIDAVGVKRALSGQVYRDERGREWCQMAAGSTIHHWGRTPWWDTLEAIWVEKVRGQEDTPVFKLIWVDGTGGSNEVILLNDGVGVAGEGGRKAVGEVGENVDLRNMILTDPAFQGSYNYSETAQMGLAAHNLRDVQPHVTGRMFYVNPKNMHSPLESRFFPEVDMQLELLAPQK
jgi:hypothetical protein